MNGAKKKTSKEKEKRVQPIRLFLSSPSDVSEERERVKAVVDQINRQLGDILSLRLEVLEWKTHVTPQIGPRAQEVINRQIQDYDIFFGIMWKRFGTPTGKAESGTEEEFRIAFKNWLQFKRPHILFYFNQKPYYPKTREEYTQWGSVLAFREELEKKGLTCTYESLEEFADMVRDHLSELLKDWFSTQGEVRLITNFNRYLAYLKSECMYMDIRGLATGEGKAHQFRIDQLYIPLKSLGRGVDKERKARGGQKGFSEGMIPRELPLQEALKAQRLLIKGDPGAGKTTFLRFLTFVLCQRGLGEELTSSAMEILYPETPPLPVLIQPAILMEYISQRRGKGGDLPVEDESPEWLVHFLEKMGTENNWNIPADDFRAIFKAGNCLFLLDGLDEVPDKSMLNRVLSLGARLISAYEKCKVVITTRPGALIDTSIPAAFTEIQIASLDDQAIDAFLSQWCKTLYSLAPEKSRGLYEEIRKAIQSRPDIHHMARTPVMLTALAVVYWNERRLPEQRAELYDSIINWLAKSREKKPGRLSADRCRELLETLALEMFIHPEGRQRQVGLRWSAEAIAGEFDPGDKKKTVREAETFLKAEMVDSGIIVERQNQVEFWHLSFQEYLAACRIGGFLDEKVIEMVFKDERIYKSEWREVILLLGGVLYKQGKDKINNLIDGIIKRGPQKATKENLRYLARGVGILGGIVRDLSPFHFAPKNPDYSRIVRSVMGIFDKEGYKQIPLEVRIEAAEALGQVGDPRLHDSPMVRIQGGIFWMGAQKVDPKRNNYDPVAYDNESPVHRVELSSYEIGKYPVTVGQFLKFVEDGGYEDGRYWKAGGFGEFEKPGKWEEQLLYPSRPVVYVSWYEAAAYAEWFGGRLPTEAEWERAARGPSGEYRRYPWGSDEPGKETANIDKIGIGKATPVGIFPEDCTPEGIIDMGGNVLEWCWDWYSRGYYKECAKEGVVRDPRGPDKGEGRVLRGGSFIDVDPDVLRCAYRLRYWPGLRDGYIGFRVVRVFA